MGRSGAALKDISSFGLYVNAIGDSPAFANGETMVNGTLYYDDIRAVSSDTDKPVFKETEEKPEEKPTEKPAGKPGIVYPPYMATSQPDVKMVNEDASKSYTITIPQSELEKMDSDIDISVNTGEIHEMPGNKKDKVTDILPANGIKAEDAYFVSIAENNTKGGIKVSAPVAAQKLKKCSNVYVYSYNSKTGKLEETANSKRQVLSDGMAGIEGYSGKDYIVTGKELSGKNVVTLISKAKISFSGTSVKKGSKIKINIVLPSCLEAKTSLDKNASYGKQAAVMQYKSSDAKVAKVSKDGTVKALNKGKTKITVKIKLADGKVKTVKKNITVK